MLSIKLEPSGEIQVKLQPGVSRLQLGMSRRRRDSKRAGGAHLSIAEKSEKTRKPKSGFGSQPLTTKFGTYGRRMVRNACGVLAAEFGRSVVFGTLTLPGSTQQARQALSSQSGRLVELLGHWLRSHSKTAKFVWVWEYQKSGALHLHFALGDSDILRLRFFERNFRQYVHKLFETLSRHSGVDMFARAEGGTWRGHVRVLKSRIETIRKSVKRYMAKYISKGTEVEGQGYPPSRWWGMSACLRDAIGGRRLATVFQHADLECLERVREQLERALGTTGLTVYTFRAPYSPHSRTHLIYAPDDQSSNVYESLVMLVKHYAATYAAESTGRGWLRIMRESRVPAGSRAR